MFGRRSERLGVRVVEAHRPLFLADYPSSHAVVCRLDHTCTTSPLLLPLSTDIPCPCPCPHHVSNARIGSCSEVTIDPSLQSAPNITILYHRLIAPTVLRSIHPCTIILSSARTLSDHTALFTLRLAFKPLLLP